MELAHALGLDIRIFFAQLINFAVLLLVLYRFAYRPLLNILDERKNAIEQGLKDAESARTKLEEMEVKEREVLEQAKKEAREIVAQSEISGKRQYEKILATAKEDADRMLEKTRKVLEAEQLALLTDAKKQVAELVMQTTEKVLAEKMDVQKDGELIRKALHKI